MIKNVFSLCSVILILIVITSCSPEGVKNEGSKESKNSEAVAKVGTSTIYKEDIGNRNLEDYINEEIYYQEGVKKGYDQKIEEQLQNFRRSNIVALSMRDVIDNYLKANPVTQEDIDAYYDKNKNEYYGVKATKFTSSDPDKLEEARKKVQDGASADTIKAEYSESILVLPLKSHTRDFSALLTDFKVGEVSSVGTGTAGDSYFVVVDDVREPNEQTIKGSIQRKLGAAAKREALKQNMDIKREEYKVEILN